jgi:hypothetical protein
MSIDMSDYIYALQTEVTGAGSTDFSTVTDDTWLNYLLCAFWSARLDGLLWGFTCDENGIITPMAISTNNISNGLYPSGGWPDNGYPSSTTFSTVTTPSGSTVTLPDIGRDMIQLIVLYASFVVIRNELRDIKTQFRVAAGSVSYEYQQSANLLVEIMKDIVNRKDIILMRLSDLGSSSVTVIDSIIARDQSLLEQSTYWVASGNLYPGSSGYGYDGLDGGW